MIDGPNFKEAHPRAQQLMDEDFYYSEIEESGPFGSDDGADTLAGFSQWRETNETDSPLIYLQQQLDEWGYPPYFLQQKDTDTIQKYMEDNDMDISHIVGMDTSIIALAFAQLYFEGTVDGLLHELTMISLNRELQPDLLQLWDEHYQPIRKEQLEKMKTVLHRV